MMYDMMSGWGMAGMGLIGILVLVEVNIHLFLPALLLVMRGILNQLLFRFHRCFFVHIGWLVLWLVLRDWIAPRRDRLEA